jgi:CDP-glucose 4,6-dehydratase
MFADTFKNKKVLITGHTGFKGSWLGLWLHEIGADVVGVSLDIPTNPSLYKTIKIESRIKSYFADVRNLSAFKDVVASENPDFIFHLAAQPIVSSAYEDPLNTMTSNVVGTLNLMEILRILELDCTAVIITSDKVYDNVEQVWGYREVDILGGKDIYSGSKAAAENIIKSYFHSFFNFAGATTRIGVARAGNVIGGGDWARDRIVVDCMKAWGKGQPVKLRQPNATRPWQHVLEPLSGYLLLAKLLNENKSINGQAYNFGPPSEQNKSVVQLIGDLSQFWANACPDKPFSIIAKNTINEANILKLNCDKALTDINWSPTLTYGEIVKFTSQWYFQFYMKGQNLDDYTVSQLYDYFNLAAERGQDWMA